MLIIDSMAAYAALVSLMNDLELIPDHPTHSFTFDNKQISSLSQTVHFLVDFLETYDSHGCTREAAEVLESRIASAAHAAHGVIESHIVNQIHAGSTQLCGKPRSYFLLDLQRAIDNMEFVKRKTIRFKERSGIKTEHPTSSAPPAPLEPLSSRDGDVQLMELLIREPSSQRVIPIVGMGGIGKTTLARNVYDHSLIQDHFDVCLWATISMEYSAESILTQLLSREKKSTTGENFNKLGEKLHKRIWSRRYLIVLDDMWSVEAWNEIHMYLPDNENGSCVIVTTRLSNLASHLSYSPFEMKFLNDDKSWELFCGKAFGVDDCPLELEMIGKKIVKRCRGLPLTVVVIGGHLRQSSKEIKYWEKVANYMNPIWSLGEEEQCLEILSLSYQHLPAYLKPCFLYMGIFQEDEWIDVSEILNIWVAEGFLKPNKSLSSVEVAENYLEDLISRNLIIVDERRWNGKAKYCIVHDTLRELCLKVAKKEKFMCMLTTEKGSIGRERRIVIPEGKLNSDMVGALESAPLLRSLIRRGGWFSDELWVESRLLRVSANVNNMLLEKDDTCFPGAHFHHVNLRYLTFFVTSGESPYFIPFSIPLVWNLQTLTIHNFGVQFTAPYEIWEMSQLKHLELVRVCLPDPHPSERSYQQKCIVLRNLHTLEVENLRLTEEVCKRMPNIKDLFVRYNSFSDSEASSYYCLQNLGHFNQLEALKCEFGDDSKWRDVALTFSFPSSVEELILRNCRLDWKELTKMIKSLSRLGSLELYNVQGPVWDLFELEFPLLKVLKIVGCDDLIYWNANSYHFPILKDLHIWSTLRLSEIPFDIWQIPTLKLIELDGCSEHAAVSAMRIVVEQESFGNHDLHLDVRFWEMEQVDTFHRMLHEECLRSNCLRLYMP